MDTGLVTTGEGLLATPRLPCLLIRGSCSKWGCGEGAWVSGRARSKGRGRLGLSSDATAFWGCEEVGAGPSAKNLAT